MSDNMTTLGYRATATGVTRLMKSGMKAVLVFGRPGIGKTAMESIIAKGVGLQNVFRIKLSHHDVPDVAGLPVPNHEDQRTYFYASGDMLPPSDMKGGVLVVIDEIGDCSVPQQNLACQMVFEERLHNYVFPKDTYFLLTSNRVADRSGANRVVTKLGNRVAIFTLDPGKDELFQYGAANGWNPTLLAFIKMHGDEKINPNSKDNITYFNSFDPSDPQQASVPTFASSRSYEFASNYLNYIDANEPSLADGHVMSELASMLSAPVAVKLCAFRKIALTMPDPDAILNGSKVEYPKKQEVLWALTLTLASKVKKDTLANLAAFLDKGPDEYLALAVRILYDTRQKELAGKEWTALIFSPKLKLLFHREK